jgi:LemA protein
MNNVAILVTATIIVLIIVVIALYNKLSVRRNQIENAKSSLDALFIQRSDLIPNVVAVVKQYMAFEQDTLRQITQMRTQHNVAHNYLNDDEANTLMKQLMINVENYPELKANTQFTNLQYSFNECEEQIAAGRRFLSSSITQYNNQALVFPSNMLAALFGFKAHQWEQASAAQRQNVNAENLFK